MSSIENDPLMIPNKIKTSDMVAVGDLIRKQLEEIIQLKEELRRERSSNDLCLDQLKDYRKKVTFLSDDSHNNLEQVVGVGLYCEEGERDSKTKEGVTVSDKELFEDVLTTSIGDKEKVSKWKKENKDLAFQCEVFFLHACELKNKQLATAQKIISVLESANEFYSSNNYHPRGDMVTTLENIEFTSWGKRARQAKLEVEKIRSEG